MTSKEKRVEVKDAFENRRAMLEEDLQAAVKRRKEIEGLIEKAEEQIDTLRDRLRDACEHEGRLRAKIGEVKTAIRAARKL